MLKIQNLIKSFKAGPFGRRSHSSIRFCYHLQTTIPVTITISLCRNSQWIREYDGFEIIQQKVTNRHTRLCTWTALHFFHMHVARSPEKNVIDIRIDTDISQWSLSTLQTSGWWHTRPIGQRGKRGVDPDYEPGAVHSNRVPRLPRVVSGFGPSRISLVSTRPRVCVRACTRYLRKFLDVHSRCVSYYINVRSRGSRLRVVIIFRARARVCISSGCVYA